MPLPRPDIFPSTPPGCTSAALLVAPSRLPPPTLPQPSSHTMGASLSRINPLSATHFLHGNGAKLRLPMVHCDARHAVSLRQHAVSFHFTTSF